MSDLRELYQDLIVDHNRKPRNYGVLAGANRRADGHNPLCGDRLTVYLLVENERISDVRFEGSGCAISVASASLMTQSVIGKSLAEATQIFERFHGVVTGQSTGPDAIEGLGKLAVLVGVREFPSRVKCATLAWHTLHIAMTQPGAQPVSTE